MRLNKEFRLPRGNEQKAKRKSKAKSFELKIFYIGYKAIRLLFFQPALESLHHLKGLLGQSLQALGLKSVRVDFRILETFLRLPYSADNYHCRHSRKQNWDLY